MTNKRNTCDLNNPGCEYPGFWFADAGNFQECSLCNMSLCENCGEQKDEGWFCPDCVGEIAEKWFKRSASMADAMPSHIGP